MSPLDPKAVKLTEEAVREWHMQNSVASAKMVEALASRPEPDAKLLVLPPTTSKRAPSFEASSYKPSQPSVLEVSVGTGSQAPDATSPLIGIGELDLKSILCSIFKTVSNMVSADRCSIFLVDKEANELYTFAFDIGSEHSESTKANQETVVDVGLAAVHAPSNRRRSEMLQAYGFTIQEQEGFEKSKSIVNRVISKSVPIQKVLRLPIGTGVAGYVARYRRSVNICDAYKDPRFNSEFDKQTGYKTQSILCLPIFGPVLSKNGEQELLGVASLINKTRKLDNGQNLNEECFTDADEDIFRNLLTLVGISIKSANLYEDSKKSELEAAKLALENIQLYQQAKTEMRKGESLLMMARSLYKEEDLTKLTQTIVSIAKDFMLADKASLFIINEEKQEVSFNLF